MFRRGLVPLLAGGALVASLGLVGCSSGTTATTSSTAAGGGAALSSTTTTAASSGTSQPAGTTVGSVPAGAISVTVGDTSGLNGAMTMKVAPATTKAGDVTFVVKNTGTIEHEVIVLKLNAGQSADKLPVVDGGDPPASVATGADKVDEGTKVGETGDPNLQPGETRSFTVTNLTPGAYALVCNIAKHYGMGMRAPFTVT